MQEVFRRLWNDLTSSTSGQPASYPLAHAHGRAVDLLRSERARCAREEKDPAHRRERVRRGARGVGPGDGRSGPPVDGPPAGE